MSDIGLGGPRAFSGAVLLLLLLAAGATAQDPSTRGHFPIRPLAGTAPTAEEVREEARRFHRECIVAPFEAARRAHPDGVPYSIELEQCLGGIQRSRLWFPSASPDSGDDVVHCLLFQPELPPTAPGPAVVLLHHLRDDVTIEAMVATWLARHGVRSLLIHLPGYGPRRAPGRAKLIEPDLDVLRRRMAQAVLDVHLARDCLSQLPGVDPRRLSLMGISLGALVGSIALGIDPGSTGPNLLLLGGGDLTTILYTESRYTRRLIQDLRSQGLRSDAVRARLQPIDPLTWAPRIPPGSVVTFNCRQDEVIPVACTRALIDRIPGEVREHWYSGSHVGLAFYLPSVLRSCGEILLGTAEAPAEKHRP